MKTILLLNLLFLYFHSFSQEQPPSWSWAKSINGIGENILTSVTVDGKNNIIVVGYFNSLITYSDNFNFYYTKDNDSYDILISKFSQSGDLLWQKIFGGEGDDKATAVAVDAHDNIYISGNFTSNSISLDAFTLNKSSSEEDIFLTKIDQNGNFVWGISSTGNKKANVSAISLDADENILMNGSFVDSLIFGSKAISSIGYGSAFLAKFTSNGKNLWITNARGHANSIAVDKNNFVYITGMGAFVAKYDKKGKEIWVKSGGGKGITKGESITIDIDENIIIGGWFYGGDIKFYNVILTHVDSEEGFLAKYDVNGNLLWAKGYARSGHNGFLSIITDSEGNIYGTGFEDGCYVMKCDSAGNKLWKKNVGSESDNPKYEVDLGIAIAQDRAGNTLIAGVFTSDFVYFDAFKLKNRSSKDMFLAKLGDNIFVEKVYADNLFPNPTSGRFTINFTLSSSTSAELVIYNIQGQRVHVQQMDANRIDIDLSHQPNGIYFIQLRQGQEIVNQKLVISR